MKTNRIYNFNAGPSALPLSVLETFSQSLFNHLNSGMSIAEISHRSSWFTDIMEDLNARIKRLLNLSDDHHILFIQGGASLQFAMIPMNFLSEKECADYINTGTWATKAIQEAKGLKKHIGVAATSEDQNFSYIPEKLNLTQDAKYLHITSNNTIKGTQFHTYPDSGNTPLIIDMSSDIFSREMNMDDVGMIYASSQKNIGFAGVSLVILREDLLETCPEDLPTMLNYRTYKDKKSMFNTPPTVSLYSMALYLKWLEEVVGGLKKMAAINEEKAKNLYQTLDQSSFYTGTAATKDRSIMNVTFRLPTEALEKKFIDDALTEDLGGLKGHRSVGGIRASIYNATTLQGVRALTSFMRYFEEKNG